MIDEERVLRVAVDSAVMDVADDRDERLAKITIMLTVGLYTVGIAGILVALRYNIIWAVYLYALLFIVAAVMLTGSRIALRTLRARRAERHALLAKLYRL